MNKFNGMENLSRRNFLKQGIKAALIITVLDPFKKCFSNSLVTKSYPNWSELVEDARWCPSVHNLQPHKLKIISASEAELYYDPKRLLPIGDPHCIFTTVAMGIFVEHLSIVAAPYGYEVTITQIGDPITTKTSELTLFARLNMQPRTKIEIFNRDLIKKRKTSRGHYIHKLISPNTLEGLKQIANEYNNEFFYTQESSMVHEIINLNQETLFEDLDSNETCKELDALFRYNIVDAEKYKDGLWNRCMGFPGKLMKRVFTRHENWAHGMKRALLGKYYRTSFKGTRTICWFGGSFKNTDDWLNCGKMLARNWLFITSEGAYIQPFGSLITNPSAYNKINKKFTLPSEGKSIWMIFRIGYSNEPTRSFRLNTEDIIL